MPGAWIKVAFAMIAASQATAARMFISVPVLDAVFGGVPAKKSRRLIRKQAQALTELMQETMARFAKVEDANPLPDATLYPSQHLLTPSCRNLYGVLPSHKDKTRPAYPAAAGKPLQPHLIETKESTKDASRMARRIPKICGRVMFVTKDQGAT